MSFNLAPWHLTVLICGALTVAINVGETVKADEPADEKLIAARAAKLRKKVEAFFRKGKGDYFAIALIENTFHTEVTRTTVRTVVVNGRALQDNATEFRTGGEHFPVPTSKFDVIEGENAAVDAIVNHMAKYIYPVRKKKGKTGEKPPPTGDWKLVGRFTEAAKAEMALNEAKIAFENLPNWKQNPKSDR